MIISANIKIRNTTCKFKLQNSILEKILHLFLPISASSSACPNIRQPPLFSQCVSVSGLIRVSDPAPRWQLQRGVNVARLFYLFMAKRLS